MSALPARVALPALLLMACSSIAGEDEGVEADSSELRRYEPAMALRAISSTLGSSTGAEPA